MLQNLWEVMGWWGSLDRAQPLAGLFTPTYGSSLPKPFSSASGWDTLQMDIDFQYDDLSLVSGWECKLREMWQCYQVTQGPVGVQVPHIHSKSNTTQWIPKTNFWSTGRKCDMMVRRSPWSFCDSLRRRRKNVWCGWFTWSLWISVKPQSWTKSRDGVRGVVQSCLTFPFVGHI